MRGRGFDSRRLHETGAWPRFWPGPVFVPCVGPDAAGDEPARTGEAGTRAGLPRSERSERSPEARRAEDSRRFRGAPKTSGV